MGFTDKIKGLIGDNKSAVQDGIDKAADVVESKTPIRSTLRWRRALTP